MQRALSPLVGSTLARLLYTIVRLGFLLSLVSIFPMQMAPFRESLSRVAFGRELPGGAPFYVLTYASVAALYGAALVSGSIWGPLQLIGATAGACIAFFFPGAKMSTTLKSVKPEPRKNPKPNPDLASPSSSQVGTANDPGGNLQNA
jgi:hypothetical protein